jgi:MarR family transcriptional regulator, organic hydroperoxide resistance regulator
VFRKKVRLIDNTKGGFLITQIKQVQSRIFEKLLAEAGVDAFNNAQGRILYILWQTSPIPIIELSQKTGLAKSTLTSMLDRMEASGLVCRVHDKVDRRQIKIGLTDQAMTLNEDYNLVSSRMNAIFYNNFSDEEIAAFEQHLNKVHQNLKDYERTNK